MKEIQNHMEELREELNILAEDIDNCGEKKLLAISQELDKVIFEYIKAERKWNV